MLQPDDNRDVRPSGRWPGIIAAILLTLAIISIAVFTYLKSQNADFASLGITALFQGSRPIKVGVAKEVDRVERDAREHSVYLAYRDYLARCGDDGIVLLDRKGREVWSAGETMNKPLLRTNGNELLVADTGGMDICVIKDKKVLWKEKTDVLIINADINASGYVTVVTESKRYNGEVRVYDPNGIELFRSIIASDFAVSAAVSPSSRQMTIDCINADGAEAGTNLKFFDMGGNATGEKGVQSDSAIYPVMWYSSDGSLFLAGDKSIAYMDKAGNIKWNKNYSGVMSACPVGRNRTAVAVEDSKGLRMAVVNQYGQEISSSPVDEKVTGITSSSGVIAVSTPRKAMFCNDSGRLQTVYSADSDIQQVCIFNSHQAAVITNGYIEILSY